MKPLLTHRLGMKKMNSKIRQIDTDIMKNI
jgi:hypothetical protein